MAIHVPKLPPDTALPGMDGLILADFWSWAYSDVLSNGNRSVFAEFLVASALDITTAPRREWDMVDLSYHEKKIEVKASGYVQSWAASAHPTNIQFDIAKKVPWDWETNTLGTIPIRSADCYVFCVFTEMDQQRAAASVLDASSWQFYVLATSEVERAFGEQKRVGLNRLRKICVGEFVSYDHLRERIGDCLMACG